MFLIFILWFTFNYKVSKTIQNVIGSKDELEQSFSDLNIDDNRGGQHIFEHPETGEIPSNDNDTTIDYFDQEY
jgi:hypothetical protein